MIHIPWPPAHLSHAKFHQLAGKITLPLSAAAIIQANRTPLEEMTVTDFRNLTQPHDLRSQLGLAMRSDSGPELLKGSTSVNEPSAGYKNPEVVITVNPYRMSAEQAARIAMKVADMSKVGLGISVNPTLKSEIHYAVDLLSGDNVQIDGIPLDEFIRENPNVCAVQASRVTGQTIRLGQFAVGGHITGKPIPVATNQPRLSHERTRAGMKERLDALDEETLSLLVDVGNRPGRDRRRVDAARTQFELAFMMLKRAIEEA